ncbi:MAG: TlpA disulfide reductase family protein [Bacteroidota bacterium]
MNQNGEGAVTIPLKKMLFVEIGTTNTIITTLFLEPGYDMLFSIEKEKKFFTGKGADANNYLLKSMVLLDQLNDSIKAIEEANYDVNNLINLYNSFELKFADFHKRYSDSIHFTKEVDYLLRNKNYSFILMRKQWNLLDFEQNEIDSLNLESKLGLLKNDIFKDTLLIQSNCSDFSTFLSDNCKQNIAKSIPFNPSEMAILPVILLNKIKESTQYSKEIKEFLLFDNLNYLFYFFGITHTIDSLSKMLKETYPTSEYLILLSDAYKKFKHLISGNPAPNFQGTTPEGKVYSLSDFKGKMVFIDVWATWCGPCIEELPYTHKLQESFKNNKDIVFLFISRDRKENAWKEYLIQHPELNGIHLRIDNRSFIDAYVITGIPRYIMIDKQGKIINAFTSKPSSKKIKKEIEDALLK